MAYIVKSLDITDVFNLSLCSRHFQYLIREERFCRAIVIAQASHTAEAREAQRSGHFSRALRRIAKRRQAFSQASPYAVGIVGVADSYEYIHGILCYIIEQRPQRWLRILDLHSSSCYELVVDIPTLIREAVPRSAKSRKYKFRVLYHADGITTCLFSFALPNTENWLLVFEAEKHQIVAKLRLESTAKIFVRNNQDYLYFGTHSEEGAGGFRNWVITGFNIKERIWLDRKMHLPSTVGYDIGSTVCFEIIDDYFYGLSNQTDFEIGEINWTSYYYCFRCPLHNLDPAKLQVMKKEDRWRREHGEGPIDDRWGFLKLEKDEATGEISIIESRKEWLTGQSGSRRTYYITNVVFDEDSRVDDSQQSPTAEGRPAAGRSIWPLADRLNSGASRPRLPQNTHPGDESSMACVFTRSQTHLRSYQRCSNTFFDLVDDTPGGLPGFRRLRLRTGHRKLQPAESRDDRLYRPNEIYFWPPERGEQSRNSFLDKIYGVLNPPDCLGSIAATSDERSIVYATGDGTDGPKFLVYLTFDPAAKLAGMVREEFILGEREKPSLGDERVDRGRSDLGVETNRITQISDDTTTEGEIKGKVQGDFSFCASPDTPDTHRTIIPHPEGGTRWIWTEKAMHHTIPGKIFTFAR